MNHNWCLQVMVTSEKHKSSSPIHVNVSFNATIKDLKDAVYKEFKFPQDIQRWILNGALTYDKESIASILHDSHEPQTVCLYLLSENETFRERDAKRVYQSVIEAPVRPIDRKTRVSIVYDLAEEAGNYNPGWICPTCTFVNLPSRPGCEICASGRPDDYLPPQSKPTTKEQEWLTVQNRKNEAAAKALSEEKRRQELERNSQLAELEAIEMEYFILNMEDFECPICFGDFHRGEGVILRSCCHMFCLKCINEYIKDIEVAGITCPHEDCEAHLEDREVRGLADEEYYGRYMRICHQSAESSIENTFHCKTDDCPGWVVYRDRNVTYVCAKCKKQNCLNCEAIHEGLSCLQYQEDLRINAKNDTTKAADRAALERMIEQGEAMNCPGCKIIIRRVKGCDAVVCTFCRMDICWATKGPRWGPGGKGDTSGGCRCKVNGKPCTKTCKNCH